MTTYPVQDSMVRGEISPRLHARASLELYRSALAICENFITLPHGGIRKRSGSYYAGEQKNSAQERPRAFIFDEQQAYCLWFGNGYFRVYAYGGPVLSGGSVVEVATPWSYADVIELQFEPSFDVLYVFHPDWFPRKIIRTAHTAWSIEAFEPEDGPFAADNTDKAVKMYASAASGNITLTAANGSPFADAVVGQIVQIKVETYETWKPWESGGFLTTTTVADILRRYNGNIYEAVEPIDIVGKIFMGGTPPVHLEGSEWDGAGDEEQLMDGVAANNQHYGVKWEYVHSGYGLARITAILNGSTASATVLVDFPAELVGSGNASYRWGIGAFGGASGFPRSGAVFEQRLMLGQKYSVYGSESFDLSSFRPGSDPTDAIAYQLPAAGDIVWLSTKDGFLVIGTIGGVVGLSGGGANEPLTPGSFKDRDSPTKRCSAIQPVKGGAVFIYVGFDRKSIVELTFSLERNGFQTTPLATISEHIPKHGISSIAFQSETDPIFWMGLDNGELAGLTYEQDQQVRGWHRQRLGGSFGDIEWGVVEWVEVTPGQSGSDDVWLSVKRTIAGTTKRYIEVLQPTFEYGEAEDAFMVDCGLTYEGAAIPSVDGVVTVGGYRHLALEQVDVLANGRVYKDIQVTSSGAVAFPSTASASLIHAGLPYTAVAETLELDVGGRDGSLLGRKKKVHSVILSVLEAANVNVRSASRTGFTPTRAARNTVVPPSETVALYTGNLDPVFIDDTWEGRGKLRIEAPDPVPCTILALNPAFDSEGS